MTFRPFPILTVFAIPLLTALVWLGVWQLQRAEWKAGLIADHKQAAEAIPVSIEEAFCRGAVTLGAVVKVDGASGPPLRMFGHNASGAAGWRLFQAAPRCPGSDGSPLVETGFERLAIGGTIGAPPAAAETPSTAVTVEVWPAKSLLSAENNPALNQWHWFDPAPMAEALGVAALDTRYILAGRSSGIPDYLIRTPPAGHIGYAVTWFGMAIGFLLIYAAFHARAGRLRFGWRRPDPV
ncbi:MAG: SURF1 family protein [Alphaproteobacteria bacterium]|nr:SURF1 family protein [Alphaproteobacteria bacterium]